MARCPQPRMSNAVGAPARRSPSAAAREATRRRPPRQPRQMRHTLPSQRPRCLRPDLPPETSEPRSAPQAPAKTLDVTHAIGLSMLTAVTIALAVALVLQDIDSALVILTIAASLTVALVVLRPASAKAGEAPPEAGRKRRATQTTGPHSALT